MKISRRHFLKSASATAASGAIPLSLTLPASAFANEAGDYKALVCLFLFGGNDSFNMLVPASGSNVLNYEASRPDIHLTAAEKLSYGGFVDDIGQSVALNSAMPGLMGLIEQGSAAMLTNVGTLLEPTNKLNYGSVSRPPNLGAHNRQQFAWQRSWNTGGYHPYGWAGMMMDALASRTETIAPEISFSGNSLLANSRGSELAMNSDGVRAMTALSVNSVNNNVQKLLNDNSASLFGRAYMKNVQEIIDFQLGLNAQLDAVPEDTSIPASSLGKQLRMVKRLIQSAPSFGQARQVFFVSTGGYDNHSAQRGKHEGLLGGVDSAVTAFYNAIVAEGLQDQVALFTMSDFGRTIQNNSNRGTDHGWGSNQFVIGGAVNGGRAYGRFPEFLRDGNDAAGNKFIPSTSSEQMAATLGKWFGLTDDSVDVIFPTLNPNNTNAFASRYLGFMQGVGVEVPPPTPAVLPLASVAASAENANGTGATANAVDGDPATKWSAKGHGITYTLSLASASTLTALRYKQAKGDVRQYFFDIEVSSDGVSFTPLQSVTTPGNTTDWVEQALTGSDVVAVRLVCNGNNDPNRADLVEWNNFVELEVIGY